MPKQKPKKQAKKVSKVSNNKEKKLKKVIYVLVCLLVITLTAGCFLMRTSVVSHEEMRRLEAFESLAYDYIYRSNFSGDENTTTEITGIGLSEDDDLYFDFRIYYYDKEFYGGVVAKEYQDGRLHFQCNKEYLEPVSKPNTAHCANAMNYEEKVKIENPSEFYGFDVDELEKEMREAGAISE